MIVRVLTGAQPWHIENGDALEVLRGIPPATIDAIVTDPPSGIGFMGREWDSDKGGAEHWIAWLSEIMAECLRVLKPGGHALVWALPRTSHWTGMAIERAGFEVRDVISHVFGSGFPKSLDVSKAIDKAAGAERQITGVKPGHEDFAGRDVIPFGESSAMEGFARPWMADPEARARYHMATEPATPEAKQWEGWGTALKPSIERWILCQRPHARNVSAPSTSSPEGCGAEASGIAHAIASISRMAESLEAFARTGTCKSPELGSMLLSIASLWKDISGALWKDANTYTIETETSLTTDLAILRSCLLKLTPASITGGAPESESLACASLAERALTACGASLCAIRTHSALGLALREAPSSSSTGGELRPDDAGPEGGSSEDWWLARKPLEARTVAAQVLETGTGALHIDACRVEAGDGVVQYSRRSEPSVNVYGFGINGSNRTGEIDTTSGRWPPALLFSHAYGCERIGKRKIKGAVNNGSVSKPATHVYEGGYRGDVPAFDYADEDGLETIEAWLCVEGCPLAELDRQSGAAGANAPTTLDGESDSIARGHFAGTDKPAAYYADKGGASRFFPQFAAEPRFLYVPKPSRAERERGCEGLPAKSAGEATGGRKEGSAGLQSPRAGAGRTAKTGVRNTHCTVKSIALMRWLVRLITPPGGIVLDPFCGSGSTGLGATREGFRFLGIEREPDYVRISKARIIGDLPLLNREVST